MRANRHCEASRWQLLDSLDAFKHLRRHGETVLGLTTSGEQLGDGALGLGGDRENGGHAGDGR
jgi:hypothetical protein